LARRLERRRASYDEEVSEGLVVLDVLHTMQASGAGSVAPHQRLG
jgi:hypothetical protein